MIKNEDIIKAVTDFAPPVLQEDYDNTGIQVGCINDECKGVLLCVDVTPEILIEAKEKGCNLIISHHPILFRGIKHLTGASMVERIVIDAIRSGITIYSSHTALDSAPGGVSARMALMLGLEDCRVLENQRDRAGRISSFLTFDMVEKVKDGCTGLGIIGRFHSPLSASALIELVKCTFNSPVARCTKLPSKMIRKVALCGGAGASMINLAISNHAEAFITSDIKYHDFVDHADDILLIDIGHWEGEYCAVSILMDVIKEKFPNFAVNISLSAENPIHYI